MCFKSQDVWGRLKSTAGPFWFAISGALFILLGSAVGYGEATLLPASGCVLKTPGCARDRIQVFLSQQGDFTRTLAWREHFQGKPLQCSGVITHIIETPQANRREVMLKVLPETRLYDTVLLLENSATSHIDLKAFKPSQQVTFKGTIVRAVDLFGLKQVFVQVTSLEALQPEALQPLEASTASSKP
jgi:hypothetical protein